MIKLSRTGVGTADLLETIRDSDGTGLLPLQLNVAAGTTARVLARVSGEAPWVEVRSPSTVDYIESISWVPYVRLEVTSGTGVANLWIGDK